MTEAFVCDSVRTPIGRYAGALAARPPRRPGGAHPGRAGRPQPGVDWAATDDVILGDANQAGEDNRNVARMAVLLAGLPVEVSGATVNRLCGSGMEAVGLAARAIKAGEADLVVAGGVESMSRAPKVMAKATTAFDRGTEVHDSTIGWRFVNPELVARFGRDEMPATAENVAAEFGVSRQDQDAFSVRSHQRAVAAIASGRLGDRDRRRRGRGSGGETR